MTMHPSDFRWWLTGPLGLLVLSALHECGHALAAALTGMRLVSLQVWRVRFDFTSRKFCWGKGVPGITGHVLFLPSEVPRWRLKRFLVMAAGPATNLLIAGLLWSQRAHWPDVFYFFGLTVLAVFMGVGNLAPFYTRSGFASDGQVIFDLFSSGEALRLKERILRETKKGLRPREWSVTPEECAAVAGKAHHGWMTLFAYAAALDTGRFDAAEAMLQRGLEPQASMSGVRHDLLLQGAIFYSLCKPDLDKAKDLLEEGRDAGDPSYARLAEAAVYCAGGVADAARTAFAEWMEATRTSASPELRRGSNEWAIDRLSQLLGT
jgi:hypothetical protein